MDDAERGRVLLLRVVESVTSGSRRRRRLASERYVPSESRMEMMVSLVVSTAAAASVISRAHMN
jgi:hypothetical protein